MEDIRHIKICFNMTKERRRIKIYLDGYNYGRCKTY